MTKLPDANSPEAMLAATAAELDRVKAANTKLAADLAAANAKLETPEAKNMAAMRETLVKMTASLQSANESNAALRLEVAKLKGLPSVAAPGAAPAATGIPADVAAIMANSGTVLTRAERERLYEHLATLPTSERHAFYKRHIGGKQEA